MSTFHRALVCASLILSACAGERDHFYTLNTLPAGPRAALTGPAMHVILTVDVPSLVDRAQMVISTSDNGIDVLEHERWAVALSDQVSQTLARDMEKRRQDVIVADRGFDQGTGAPVTIKVDIVRMSAQLAGHAHIEAHWRVVDPARGTDQIGADVFDAPVDAGGYASIAKAFSQALSGLADRLAAGL